MPYRRLTLPLSMFIMAAVTVAALAAFIPNFQCTVLAQCGANDLWCNGDCSIACQPATSLGYVARSSCVPNVTYCAQTFIDDQCAVRCSDPNNCNVTDLVGGGNCAGRLFQRAGFSYWNAGECIEDIDEFGAITCTYEYDKGTDRVDCCTGSGSGGGGGGGKCTPEYAAPTVTLSGVLPVRPLVIGQDPDDLGATANILIQGGEDTACHTGRTNITSITIPTINLSPESIAYIRGELARRYPGAQILGDYPLDAEYPSPTLPDDEISLALHFDPLDPGTYQIVVQAVQEDGQTVDVTLEVKAWLLDSTLDWGVP